MPKQSFEFHAQRYRQASAHQKEWGEKVISDLELRGDERILDLGCGDGSITAAWRNRFLSGM